MTKGTTRIASPHGWLELSTAVGRSSGGDADMAKRLLCAHEPSVIARLRLVLRDLGMDACLEPDALVERVLDLVARGRIRLEQVPAGRANSGVDMLGHPRATTDGASEVEGRQHWIEIVLRDERDRPIAGAAYEIVLPDGSRRRGRTNAHGVARYEHTSGGECEIGFIDFHEDAWKYLGEF